MRYMENHLLREREEYFVENLCPVDLFPYLSCLSVPDKEQIECDSKQNGDSRATQTLFDRLIRRGDEAFPIFVRALRETGYDNLAMILDPHYQVEQNVEQSSNDTHFLCVAGPAIDVRVTLRIINEGNKQICNDLEHVIAKQFDTQKSEQCKTLRKQFAKHLPQGATFLCTVSDGPEKSIQMIFRLSRVEAADEFWEMYQAKDLNRHLRDMLPSYIMKDALDDKELKFDDKELKFDVHFLKDVHENARKRLEDLESGQVYTQHSLQIDGVVGTDLKLQDISLPEFKIPKVYLDNGKGQQAIDLNLRNYQKELSKPAIDGHNTIICAPTNSGKTYVALQIARNHLELKDGKGKVLFLVSTVNLVLQQRERFQLYLNDKYKITEMSSAHTIGDPLEQKVKTNDVVVLTAQILVNALREKRLSLHDISMLIFDECHHTHGEHPYNKTMEFYMTLALQPGLADRLPQVIGMTASLGVGKARNLGEAQNHILYLCANLDTKAISTVKDHQDELIKHTSTPKRTVHPVYQNRNDDIFNCIINQVMENIEAYVQNSSVQADPSPTGRESQRYRQWCETLYENSVIAGNRYVVTYAEQLREYNIALSINEATRMKDAKARLKKYFDRLREDKFTDVDRKLKQLYLNACDALDVWLSEHGEPLNPKLVKIQEILLELNTNNKDAKGILFSKTRETTVALENWIKENDVLKMMLKPLRLVGSNDREGASMTQNDQEEVISKFKHGRECNLIIATTVAEEGLDIDDCNYVIRYDMIGNEISSVQSRGRIRTLEGGQYCSVIGADSGGLEKEHLNRYRECLMTEALAHVQKMDQNAYKEKIEDCQKEAAKERTLKERLRECLKSQYDPNDVTFKCRRCQVVACQAHDLRRVKSSFHVVIPDDFDGKIDKIHIPPSSVQSFHEVSMPHKIKCKKCGEHWGCTVNLRGLEMPCLKVECFVLEIRKGTRVLKIKTKKWKKCPFDVPRVEISELLDLKVKG